MRGAFYVTTALLITNSIRAAAEANRSEYRQTSYHDGVVTGGMGTKSTPRRFHQGSHEPHDNFAVSATNEERMPEAPTRITASLGEEALDTVRKATHFTFDLNAPPEETSTGALEAYHILRDQDPRTYTASSLDVSRSHLSNKRTAQALTSPGQASGSATPKKLSGGQPKKPRTSASLKDTEVQSIISRDTITFAPRGLSNDDVQIVHSLYLQHLKHNSAVFAPKEDETRKMLGMIKKNDNWVPSSDQTYTQYSIELMQMNLQSLKELGLNSNTVLYPKLQEFLEQSSKDLEEIQLCLLRLLCLRRWMHMYRDFFSFCHSNPKIRSNFSAASRLQVALQMSKAKVAESSVEVAPYFAVLGTKETRNTNVEINMFKDVETAVKKANIKWADKMNVYKLLEDVPLDKNQLAASGHFTPIAKTFKFRTGKERFDIFKTPLSPSPNEESLPGGPGKGLRDRNQIFELVDEATNRATETTIRYKKAVVKPYEQSKFLQLRDVFKKDSEPDFAPTLEMIKMMWRLFNWKRKKSDPRKYKYAGHYLRGHVCRLDQMELETALGLKRVNLLRATQHMEEGDENYLLQLRTEYLMKLLEMYDKFYPFCVKYRYMCKKESIAVHSEPSQ